MYDWNELRTSRSLSGTFFDETLRDGIQAPGVQLPTLDQKLEIIDLMYQSGIRSADLGFPGSGPAALAECLELSSHAAGYPAITQAFAGRTHPSDVRAICEIGQRVGTPVEAYVFIGVSPIRQYVEDWDTNFLVRSIRAAGEECQRGGADFVLVLEDAVRCSPEVLAALYDTALDVGVRRLALCDTVGAAVPSGTAALIRWTAEYFATREHVVALDWHGHNDRGLALANSLVALATGCDRVHGTVLGVGERAGNASIDQLILNTWLDDAATDYDLMALSAYCDYVSASLAIEIPPNYPAMGRDVFKTSAGVHAAAILKAHEKEDAEIKDLVYSSVPARFLGREQEIVIDASAGVSNVRYWLATRGLEADDAAVLEVLRVAKSRRQPMDDNDVRQLLENL
ncbi:LeuA family protein [Kribbella deserti]|uniref:2-isopropylmalate synthase n=1 Tax=Kribbella deserti TaxID=1926257 RepID=A0ABV6QN31_9ACTN